LHDSHGKALFKSSFNKEVQLTVLAIILAEDVLPTPLIPVSSSAPVSFLLFMQ
jgi:hypothetical protein